MAIGIYQNKEGGYLMRIVKGIILIVVLLAIVGVAGYVALSFISSCMGPSNMPDIPEADEAAYSVTIENTGKLIMTDDYEVMGSEVGSRVFILHGYWEFMGQDFKYKEGDIIMDEAVFGKITLRRR
jgi:hypothetical protein